MFNDQNQPCMFESQCAHFDIPSEFRGSPELAAGRHCIHYDLFGNPACVRGFQKRGQPEYRDLYAQSIHSAQSGGFDD